METREQFLLRNIRERNEAIGNGGSVENIERWNREIKSFEEELARLLQEAQELPPEEEVKTEPILSTVDGLPLAVFAKNEDAAILIQCEAEAIVERLNKANVVVVGVLNNKLHLANELELSLRQRNAELERDYQLCADENKEMVEENVKLTKENHQLTNERNEALEYRNNAVQQLEDMAFELEQNRIELNRNREVRALTEAERTAEQEAARQRFLDSRIKIYNPRNADELNSRERIANLAETGEEITYLAIYEKGTYVDIGSEAALAIQAMNAELNAPEVDEEAIFPETASGESTSSLDATEDQGEQREALELEPETFEERTERRLNAIEHRLNKNEPEFIHDIAS